MKFIKYWVQDECILGYVIPGEKLPTLYILRASIIKGCLAACGDPYYSQCPFVPARSRPATEKDFDDFGVYLGSHWHPSLVSD